MADKRKLKIRIFPGVDGQFYFRILAGNGERIAASEGYKTKAKARKTATLLRDCLHEASIEEGED